MGIFIAVLVVLAVLIYFMVVILKSVASEANGKVEEYFLHRIKDYDNRFDAKFSDMNEMYVEHELLSRRLKSVKNELVASRVSTFYAPRPIQRDIFIPTARYIDNDFFEEYKITKDKLLGINKQEVIDNVIAKTEYTGDMSKYQAVCSILDKVNFDAMYDLVSVDPDEQLQVMKECLEDKELEMLDSYMEEFTDEDEFEILGFSDYLKRIKEQNDPHVFVFVGINEDDYSNEERMIVCSEDDNICEGLKIIYQHKVYDYSIYKSRRKVGS